MRYPTLTIWTGAKDEVDKEALMDFVNLVGKKR